MICDETTWVPHFHILAAHCHALRLAYFHYGLQGAHGAGIAGRNCATIFYRRAAGGGICHVTCSSEAVPGAARHSEAVCIEELLARENWTYAAAAAHVVCVYTERMPCGPDLHNCRGMLAAWLPADIPCFWSFDYPAAVDIPSSPKKHGRDGGGDDDARREAKDRRAQGTKDLKHSLRDIDYSASTFHSGSYTATAVAAGPVQDARVAASLKRLRLTGRLPRQTPFAGAE